MKGVALNMSRDRRSWATQRWKPQEPQMESPGGRWPVLLSTVPSTWDKMGHQRPWTWVTASEGGSTNRSGAVGPGRRGTPGFTQAE